jgi:hypothetical protein
MNLNDWVEKINPHEIAMWEVVEDRFCGLLWKHWPSSRLFALQGNTIQKIAVNLDCNKCRGAMISVADHDFKPGEGLRTGLKDLKIEVFDRRITEDILVQFEAWFIRHGKRVRIILNYPWIDQMPTRYELGRVETAASAH